tara:strand:- start:270 stop:806 length:537 start_codon:yes stop_codon:yes gene_type:complete
MRIISGLHRGRRINMPKKLVIRPTTNLGKESLFNILNNSFDFTHSIVLDLFSGTGGISYEFASRGCVSITSVDINKKSTDFIKSVSDKLMLNLNVIKSDIFRFINITKSNYDIIFADPPYNMELKKYEELITNIFKNKLLKIDGVMIIEHSKINSLKELKNYKETRIYGGCCFSFFKI